MAGDLIGDYLHRLAAGLPPGVATAPVLAEVEDGLRTAVEARVSLGAERSRAAELAVAEFGDPRDLAAEFAPVLAAREAHRDGIGLLVTGPIVGIPWLAAALLAWPTASDAVRVAAAVVLLALATAIPCAVFAVAATGRLSRWVTVRGRTAVRAVTLAVVAAIALDTALVLLGVPALLLLDSHGHALAAAACVAAGTSLIRLRLTTATARRLRHARTGGA